MDTQVLTADTPGALDQALQVLRSGGLVAFPTDTVYGLGALAFDDQAARSIYAAKGRTPEKAIPVLLADVDALYLVADEVPSMALRLASRFWPGPLTLVVRKNRRIPAAVSVTDTVGIRVPDHDLARLLLRAAGPMAVTSANASGGASPSTAAEVLIQLTGRLPLILDGGRTPGGVPSTVVDCTGTEPTLLRAGPVSIEEIRQALK